MCDEMVHTHAARPHLSKLEAFWCCRYKTVSFLGCCILLRYQVMASDVQLSFDQLADTFPCQ